MKTLLFYVLQVVLCSGILYGYYLLVLRNKKFHQYNRFYLLLIVLLSFIIPLLEFTIKTTELGGVVDSQVLQNIFIKSYKPSTANNLQQIGNWLLDNAVAIVYIIIAGFLLLRLVKSILQLIQLKHKYKAEKLANVQLYRTNEPGTPFSFFNWLFWDNHIVMESGKGKQIFKHELYHIQQKHSWDIIAMELVCVIVWMNPFFHVIRKEQATIHEFLADQYAMQHQDKWEYAELLLLQAIGHKQRLTHPFFNNQIKRRIAMITNVNKTSFLYVRKLLVLPLLLLVVAIFAINCTNDDAGKEKVADHAASPGTTVENAQVTPDSGAGAKVVEEKQIPLPNVEEKQIPPPPPPPKIEERKFILPKSVKDGESKNSENPTVELKKFTPPKVVKDKSGEEPVYQKVEVEAGFPGGQEAWANFLKRNLNPNVPVDKGAPSGRYTIFVQFIVDKDGTVSDLKPITNHGYGMENEVMRVMKIAKMWVPATNEGKVVKSYRKQPITFIVENE